MVRMTKNILLNSMATLCFGVLFSVQSHALDPKLEEFVRTQLPTKVKELVFGRAGVSEADLLEALEIMRERSKNPGNRKSREGRNANYKLFFRNISTSKTFTAVKKRASDIGAELAAEALPKSNVVIFREPPGDNVFFAALDAVGESKIFEVRAVAFSIIEEKLQSLLEHRFSNIGHRELTFFKTKLFAATSQMATNQERLRLFRLLSQIPGNASGAARGIDEQIAEYLAISNLAGVHENSDGLPLIAPVQCEIDLRK